MTNEQTFNDIAWWWTRLDLDGRHFTTLRLDKFSKHSSYFTTLPGALVSGTYLPLVVDGSDSRAILPAGWMNTPHGLLFYPRL